jgi:hypothetical protein
MECLHKRNKWSAILSQERHKVTAMAKKITYSLTVQFEEGLKLADSKSMEVEAYDVIEITVPAKENSTNGTANGTAKVEVQPGSVGQVQFLLIRSNHYADGLTYQVNGTANTIPSIKLDAQQLFMGDGAVELLGKKPPETLHFTNTTATAAAIQILVGRKATS